MSNSGVKKMYNLLMTHKQVNLWCTINEPRLVSTGYGTYVGGSPPDLDQYFNGIGDYMTWRNLLLAHAAIYRAYKKTGQKGESVADLRERYGSQIPQTQYSF